MASRNSRGSRRWLAPVVATVAALSVGYYVYQKLSATDATKETPGKATPKQTVPQTTKISIVVSRVSFVFAFEKRCASTAGPRQLLVGVGPFHDNDQALTPRWLSSISRYI
jgi:hypothetical protein